MTNPYEQAYGTWKVTTEGDCEGRSIRDLGTYTGYLDEMAFALADKCCYSLQFDTPISDIPIPIKKHNKVLHPFYEHCVKIGEN